MGSLGELAAAHVRRFNEAVRTGDWSTFADGFTEDATVTFTGPPVPAMAGRAAIEAGYRSAPPDDTITALATREAGDQVEVAYAWDKAPGELAGTMTLQVANGLITRLAVRLD
ncbi:nuclear transport factor 2 family protein [Lentzea tibetensis]|uniref:Nuclear transport factor 2 family protein n=1 Tax=Lentzea tibetensis TaxID=2591470 RepID=A0A563F2R9_9PSEU|nr:nuclear transport factor 2 family protein [Lentzea tibetensis]TWP54213.1 nuclear transport factor 2 family protein [Lentzea tibetensis]